MKSFYFILIAFLITLQGCLTGKISHLQTKIDSVCKEAIPDKRIDKCQVKVEKGKQRNLVITGELLSPSLKTKIMEIARESCPKITDHFTVLPDTSVIKEPWGLITISVSNLKGEPSHSSEMVSQAIMGTPVRILKTDNDWFYIQTPDHYLAWTTGSSVQPLDQNGLRQWKNAERMLYTEVYGAIYSDTTASEIVSDLVAGSIVVKTGESGNYIRVVLPDQRTGYARKDHFQNFNSWENNTVITAEKLIATAKKFLGIPYLWGGTSSKAIDCSGFMKNVWFLNGIILERDASQQFKHGTALNTENSLENLQPGTQLFFGKKQPLRIIHTGMYIGNGEVIHSAGRVRINSMNPEKANFSKYLWGTFVGARQILNQPSQFGYMPVREHPWY